MKNNSNNKQQGNYYLGLDVGTNSAGWAVSDTDYNILKFHGKHMWGARLFEAANTAEERRKNRTARRRLNRRRQRLEWLEMIFNPYIMPMDPNFFIRLKDSFFYPEDKRNNSCKYSLFNDSDYNDKDFYKEYPTIYHLRKELVHSDKPHDPRLVFLALHQLMKNRGHFLFNTLSDSDSKSLDEALIELDEIMQDEFGMEFKPENRDDFGEILHSHDSVKQKQEQLLKAYGYDKNMEDEDKPISLKYFIHMFSGAKIQFKDLFKNDSLKDAEIKSISLKDDIGEKTDQLLSFLTEEQMEIIEAVKIVFDLGLLKEALGNEEYICDAKVKLFEKNKEDLQILKKYVKTHCTDKYEKIFKENGENNNFPSYIKDTSAEKHCTQEEFCKFLKNELSMMFESDNEGVKRIATEIEENRFFTKLKSTSNSITPYQIEYKEVVKILENAAKYLPLDEKDDEGKSAREKVESIFKFRVPYYVGPLNEQSDHAWLDRSSEKIYPWNFEKIVNTENSADKFMKNLIGRCTYTGDPVLPRNSLLYETYTVLNEINPLKINGKPITVEMKQKIYHDLFEERKSRITKKTVRNYLKAIGYPIEDNDTITGVADDIKSSLKSYHHFKNIIDKTGSKTVEEIIQRIIVFGDDKKKLKNWLKKNVRGIDDKDVSSICRVNCKDWGRLSKAFLTEIKAVNEDGEICSVIEMLWNENKTLMEILHFKAGEEYDSVEEEAQKYKKQKYGDYESINKQIEEMYIAPAVKRSIRQTMRIVDEIVDIEKCAPKKIFIEMARDSSKELKGQRTESRKNKLLNLYKACKKDIDSGLFEKLEGETDQRLKSRRLYLYYTQFGKCMYTGDKIDLSRLLDTNDKTYDLDHIFPKSRIKDDSLDNLVLVKSIYNRDKTNTYPISKEIQTKMTPFWAVLHSKKLISDKKYQRLTRNYPLTQDELADFVASQLNVTQQSTLALAKMLKTLYPTANIVYSKAGNVSDFRQKFELPKFRNINDQHHAKDAYLNIVVGNVYDTKFTKRFMSNIMHEQYSLNQVFENDIKGAWIAGDGNATIATVKKYMALNDPIVTFMPFEQKGSITDIQPMKKGKGQLPIKKNLSIDKYGGYNNISGRYWAVVEYDGKKARERAILPVYAYKKKEYEEDPVGYCENILQLKNPKIIVGKMLFCSQLEINGNKLVITGRTGRRILYKHNHQFYLDNDKAKYLKFCEKYIDLCKKMGKDVEPSPNDLVSEEGNIEMYDTLRDKLSKKPYSLLFKPLLKDLKKEENEEKFKTLSVNQQCQLLLNILHVFICDRTTADISLLNKKKNVGVILVDAVISKCMTAYLMHQSPTGLYEYKIDLLKAD